MRVYRLTTIVTLGSNGERDEISLDTPQTFVYISVVVELSNTNDVRRLYQPSIIHRPLMMTVFVSAVRHELCLSFILSLSIIARTVIVLYCHVILCLFAHVR